MRPPQRRSLGRLQPNPSGRLGKRHRVARWAQSKLERQRPQRSRPDGLAQLFATRALLD
jgi:hypothetical protein